MKLGNVVRYLKQYYRPAPDAVEVLAAFYPHDYVTRQAYLYRPRRRSKGRMPAWIVLHGLTYHGARHRALTRFATALAASGHIVFIPEIPEWSQLQVTPALTTATIRASVDVLRERDDVDPDRIGVFGFSFGATQALLSARYDDLAQHIKAIVAWGGYADLARLVHFGLTGEHDVDGKVENLDPDPYGRWVFGANYLTSIPGYEDMGNVANSLLELARDAGRSGTFAGDPIHDPLKKRLAAALSPHERDVYELFAPTTSTHDMVAAGELAKKLAATIAAKDPLMDAMPHLPRVRIPTILAHGRDDRLVPYTETIRIQRALPPALVQRATVTGLFSHSGGMPLFLHPVRLTRELTGLMSLLNDMLTTL